MSCCTIDGHLIDFIPGASGIQNAAASSTDTLRSDLATLAGVPEEQADTGSGGSPPWDMSSFDEVEAGSTTNAVHTTVLPVHIPDGPCTSILFFIRVICV